MYNFPKYKINIITKQDSNEKLKLKANFKKRVENSSLE